ncbi:amidase family protein [Salisediminibacterium beveridgei]|uniref:6-aminohexanoate-cyclic-dimer hydrolase n=1 Tax=Salisediminibacterium beveridgei TaxID=632773 RepID=A0A1D7QVD8_9BACI|nr:amidase family protein [Salisediminibacterium beveridgei]AOM82949.1 6-aminohexanoate-cyclic-dimer hydrolase [Salisediminibacterium beveridgei]
MRNREYARMDAIQLSQLVTNKELKHSEIIDKAFARISGLNPSLNAVISKRYPNTSEQTLFKGTPFAGVPMLLKNMSQGLKGEPLTSGSYVLRNKRCLYDSEYTKRMKNSGFMPMGHTNVPEFSLMAVTEPLLYGPTRNPWDLDYTPGGSSGGSAAAVASGMVPVAGANDGGGSIRIPASYCGLVGLKPTRGRTPVGPDTGRNWQGASQEGILTRSVRDTAAIMDHLSGSEEIQAFQAPLFNGSYLDLVNKPIEKKLKIGYSIVSPVGGRMDESIRSDVLQTAKWLSDQGHDVEEVIQPVDGEMIARSYMTLYFGETAAKVRSIGKMLGRPVKRSEVEPVTWLLNLVGTVISAEEFVSQMAFWDEAAIRMTDFHHQFDIYLTPVTAMPPAQIGELSIGRSEERMIEWVSRLKAQRLLTKLDVIDDMIFKSLERTPFTQLANLTGQPAVSLPIGMTQNGLPTGVQFMSARGREDLLIQIAGMLEQTDLWYDVYDNQYMRLNV